MRHPKFQWDGFDTTSAKVHLALHLQYPANETIHRKILEFTHAFTQRRGDVLLYSRNWSDEAKRAEVVRLFKLALRRAVRAADTLDERGDLSIWIEVEEQPAA